MSNILTIDIEDYFQVHAFSRVIKQEDWDNYECRIERNTDRLLSILNDSSVGNRNTATPHHRSTAALNDSSQLNTQHSNLNVSLRTPHSALRTSMKATFFVLGWIAERYPDLVRRIQKDGHEIACHGYAHRLVYTQSREEFRQDIKKAKSILEDITGSEVIGYRAPSYSITHKSQWAFEVLAGEGFKYDSSVFPIHHDFYGLPGAPRFPFIVSLNGDSNVEFSTPHTLRLTPHYSVEGLTPNSEPRTPNRLVEFPISTVKVFGQNFPISGGGYFRLFPYPLIKRGLKSINRKENRPFLFYIHPWEIDPGQPRVNGLSSRSSFRHYVNLDKTEGRFRKLLKDFQFSTIRQFLTQNSLWGSVEF